MAIEADAAIIESQEGGGLLVRELDRQRALACSYTSLFFQPLCHRVRTAQVLRAAGIDHDLEVLSSFI